MQNANLFGEIPNPLLDTSGPVDTLTLERAGFTRRMFTWREGERRFLGRYSWNSDGKLSSKELRDEARLYAYDEKGNEIACYHVDASGKVVSREIREWDERSRLLRRIVKSNDPPTEEIYTYEHDEDGRMRAERRGNHVRVAKWDADGSLAREYLYEGEKPDLVTEYNYYETGDLKSVITRSPQGTPLRRTLYTLDNQGRVASEIVYNADERIIKDEVYQYGAAHGERWLERISWIPDGRRGNKRHPREVIYRSFTYGGNQKTGSATQPGSLAFANGVYSGPVRDGRPEGNGVFQYNDESRYEGEFHDGKMEGEGRLIWADGRVMEGRYERGLLEGRGKCVWPDGSNYEGDFRRGKMDGSGVFTWADGTRFEGIFDKGERTEVGNWERPGKI